MIPNTFLGAGARPVPDHLLDVLGNVNSDSEMVASEAAESNHVAGRVAH